MWNTVFEAQLDLRNTQAAFLKSYYLSNTKYPQTRFYFVIDFASRLEPDVLAQVLNEGVRIPERIITSLARSSSLTHERFGIAKALTPEMIVADIRKMELALEATYAKYAVLRGLDMWYKDFITSCAELKIKVDERDDFTRSYLEQISGRESQVRAKPNTIRSENYLLAEFIGSLNGVSPALLSALEEEITRQVWVIKRG